MQKLPKTMPKANATLTAPIFSFGSSPATTGNFNFGNPTITTTTATAWAPIEIPIPKFSNSESIKGNKSELPRSGYILERHVEALFEWEIHNFPENGCPSLNKDKEEDEEEKQIFYSPIFPYSGCYWYLKLEASGWLSLHSNNEDSRNREKNIAFTFGLRKPDGTLKEIAAKKSASIDDRSAFLSQNLMDEIESLGHKLPCKLAVTCRMKDEKLQAVKTQLKELETLSLNFRDLLKGKTNHDVTIKAKDKEFQVHRVILAARSPVFAAMFEHNLSEKETGVVDVEDSDPESFGDFLEYLYTGSIGGISFRSAYHLYVTAHKYEIKELKLYCVAYMRRNLAVKNVCDVAVMADQYDEDSLMDSAHAFFNRNAAKIFATVEWETLMRKNCRLANRLLKEMVSTV